MMWTLPNLLTIARLLAAPGLALAFLLLPRPAADWTALALFLAAAATDWLDGRLARAWQAQSRLGTMLDPIADKAMVALALLTLMAVSSLSPWLLLPAALILLREVFVSGLREFLGDTAGMLRVTRLAKWKTSAQMTAIAVLFAHGLFEHYVGMGAWGMDRALFDDILARRVDDLQGLRWKHAGMIAAGQAGLALIWIAAALTLITGWDYLQKAWPHLKEE